MRLCLLLLACLLLSPPAVRAEDPLAAGTAESALTSLLVLEPFGKAARTLWNVDPVEAARVKGTLAVPVEGGVVTAADGATRAWRRVQAGEGGAYREDAAWEGGYGYTAVPSEAEEVRLLCVSGPARLFWNGEPRVGDVYGTIEARLPVLLKRGANTLLLRFGRGAPRLRWMKPPAPLFFDAHDATLPDVLPDMLPAAAGGARATRPCWIGVLLFNATGQQAAALEVETAVAGAPPLVQKVVPPPPYGLRKLPLQVTLPSTVPGPTVEVVVRVRGAAEALRLSLDVKPADATHKRTFVSGIDGSVQYYAWRRPGPGRAEGSSRRCVLSLHGARVEAGQARAYAAKRLVIVAPTNRRPYGFDWEGWGRHDAREVLKARRPIVHDPPRVYLTGHSMGGHGIWSLGADPGHWAAIAPSAGWPDFWSYAGAPGPHPTPRGRAASAPRT